MPSQDNLLEITNIIADLEQIQILYFHFRGRDLFVWPR